MDQLPHSLDAEKAVLGSILVDAEVAHLVFPVLKPEDFYSGEHTVIYGAFRDLESDVLPLDYVTVVNKLDVLGVLESIGGTDISRS